MKRLTLTLAALMAAAVMGAATAPEIWTLLAEPMSGRTLLLPADSIRSDEAGEYCVIAADTLRIGDHQPWLRECEVEMSDADWCTADGRDAVMLNGLPRLPLF